LTHGWEGIACAQFAAFYEASELIHNLLKRCEIGVDREKQIAHDAEEDWRLR
jgi:hypothetical protein